MIFVRAVERWWPFGSNKYPVAVLRALSLIPIVSPQEAYTTTGNIKAVEENLTSWPSFELPGRL